MSLARPNLSSGSDQPLPEPFAGWFKARGWTPRAYQLDAARQGRAPAGPTLLIAPTGAGKTLAGFLPTLVESTTAPPRRRRAAAVRAVPAAARSTRSISRR